MYMQHRGSTRDLIHYERLDGIFQNLSFWDPSPDRPK